MCLRTVVLRPPAEVTAANNIVEYKADDDIRHVVERCGRRKETRSREDYRLVDLYQRVRASGKPNRTYEVDVFEPVPAELLVENILDYRSDRANKEEIETIVFFVNIDQAFLIRETYRPL